MRTFPCGGGREFGENGQAMRLWPQDGQDATFQLPGYYKYGSINGRIFMYIPIVGFLAVLLFVSRLDVTNSPIIVALIGNPIVTIITVLLVCIIAYMLSIIVSIKIVQSKEV